jgi:hypothetical protein
MKTTTSESKRARAGTIQPERFSQAIGEPHFLTFSSVEQDLLVMDPIFKSAPLTTIKVIL